MTYDWQRQARRRELGLSIEYPPTPLVAGLFGRGKWREWLHPRDRHGRWIEKFSRVKVFGRGSDQSQGVGQVERLNRDGTVAVRMVQGAQTGHVISATPDMLEESMAKAVLPSIPHPPPAEHVEKPRAPWAPTRPILTGDAKDLGATYADVQRSLQNTPVVHLDFETTGLYPEAGDRPFEVAAVRMVGDRVVDRFHAYMNPGKPIHPKAAEVTGVNDAMVADKPPHTEIVKQLKDYIGNDLVSAYNASFDMGMLTASLRDTGDTWEPRGVIDPLSMARALVKNQAKGGPVPNHKLESLADYFNIQLDRAHAADADTEAVAHLLGALLKYAEEHGATLADMHALEEQWKDELPGYYHDLDQWLKTQS